VTTGRRADAGADEAVGRLLREFAPQVLGAVARRHSDFAAAEDAVQEALIAAAARWPAEGVPANPRGWLYSVALRRLTDHLRSEAARRRREDAVATAVWADWAFVPPPDADAPAEQDDTLALLFLCCHPALTPPSAVALTLRAVGGLTTAEIAAAFSSPRRRWRSGSAGPSRPSRRRACRSGCPTPGSGPAGCAPCCTCSTSCSTRATRAPPGPALHRADLSGEAIRLARLLRPLVPGDGEAAGLLALMLLTDARRAARTGPTARSCRSTRRTAGGGTRR
jgi:RNA polymerase sigma factor (sigma-70 family)